MPHERFIGSAHVFTRARRTLALTVLLGAFSALAFAQDLSALGGVRDQPSLRAARAQLQAAQSAAQAAGFAWGVSGQVGYNRAELPSGLPGPAPVTRDGTLASVAVSVSPFPFGDSADALGRARLAVAGALSAYRQALVDVQASAMNAAQQWHLAREALSAARTAADVAQQSLSAARAQRERGVVSVADLRGAEASARDAAERVAVAAENVRVAEFSARQYWAGEIPLLPLPALPQGAPTALEERARLELQEAEVNLRNAERNLLPTVQASYTRADDRTQWGVSLDSRTLAPRVSVSHATLSDPTRARSTASLAASFDLSSNVLANVNAARLRVSAAQASLMAAEREAGVRRFALETQLTQATRALQLREAALQDAQRGVAEARDRETLGLISPLETLRAVQQQAVAVTDVHAARAELLARLLDLYRLNNTPLLEVSL